MPHKKIEYFEMRIFSDIFLEESYIVSIKENSYSINFRIEFAINEEHPLYRNPKDDEKYCYIDGNIIFHKCKNINWVEKNLRKSGNLNNISDYGNIDRLYLENNYYYIFGDIGILKLNCSKLEVLFDDAGGSTEGQDVRRT